MLRKLLEYISKGIILKRRLPADFGSRALFVSPEGGGLRYWKPTLKHADPMLFQVVKSCVKPGHTVWDVGGNVGLFAFTSAVQAEGGRIAVFEPDITLCALLQKSAQINPDLCVDIFPLAVSDRTGIAALNIAKRSRSSNFLTHVKGLSQSGGVQKTINVLTVALDAFLDFYERPDFIKIDVEGAEHLVFKGMNKILSEIRPKVLCEIAGENSTFIDDILKKHNYKIYDADMLPIYKEVTRPVYNTLAIPE